MCGICGWVDITGRRKADPAVLKGMLDTIAYRGPDDEGVYIKENVALGHRRLSIIDLTTGHQPIFNEDSSICIVYNGEIYNFVEIREELEKTGHIFRTKSDTEVIVHSYEEWGEDCLSRFNGMFSFAIWDSRRKAIFLARDRFGKKPLYYAVFDNQFIFASELKAILKHPAARREIDMDALGKYLAYEYVPSPYSIFKYIYKLEAGSRLCISTENISALSAEDAKDKVRCYWDIDFTRKADIGPEDAKKTLVTLLKESVRKRLISDVPLGVFLSGGIDSSAVVSMMAELMDPGQIKTFSIGFKERSFDESDDARRVADYFGTDHHEEVLDPKAMLEVFPSILDFLDEPFADSSIIPTYLVSRFTRNYVKVALGGDGGDELFLGYPSFLAHEVNKYSAFLRLFKPAASFLFNMQAPRSDNYTSSSSRMARFFKGLDFPDEVRQQVWTGSFIPEDEKRLFLHNAGLDYSAPSIYSRTVNFYRKMEKACALDRASYIYIKTYMTDDILAKVDRASMAASLEVRAPFLDTEFAAFVAGMPSSLKLRGFDSKWILKEALKNKLPESTLKKPKRGFAVPVARWLKDDLRHLLDSAFDKKKIEKEGIFDYNYINAIIDEFLGGRRDRRKEIWALFMFEMWYDRWMR